jgi:GrpB-like predicted nucleotidyltransferase (UPF0157 family)
VRESARAQPGNTDMATFALEDALAKRAEVRAALLDLEAALDGKHPRKVRALHEALETSDPMVLELLKEVFGPFAMPLDGDPKPPHP